MWDMLQKWVRLERAFAETVLERQEWKSRKSMEKGFA